MTWTDTRFAPPADLPARSITVNHLRKDGKLMVTYFYPTTGRRIRALRTREQLQSEQTAGYQVFGIRL